jgi:hypothetical protein
MAFDAVIFKETHALEAREHICVFFVVVNLTKKSAVSFEVSFGGEFRSEF